MLNTEWAQVEVIDLINDGSGLGFGIIGGRSTGVVVKTILPGGVADRDARLQSGDHILQIGEVNLRGMGSDQVAVVLRQSGSHVRLVVARPIEPTSPDFQVRQVGRSAPIVETRVLNDPEELDRRLSLLQNGYTPASSAIPTLAINAPAATTNGQPAPPYTNGEQPDLLNREKLAGEVTTVTTEAHLHYQHPQVEGEGGSSASSLSPPVGAGGPLTDAHQEPCGGALEEEAPTRTYTEEELSLLAEEGLPEMETIELEVTKDHQGLGITIAGYVCEKEELSGIFVKSINAGSAADRNGQIQVNDQIVEVDGRSLAGLSNHAAVDVLRATGQIVHLRLARYLRGPKYEQLQQAIANSELKTTPTTPNPPRAPVGRGSLKHRSRGSLRTAVTRQANIGGAQRPTSLVPVLVAPPPGGGGGGGGVAQHSVNQVSRSDSCTPPQPEPRRPRPQRPSRLGDLPSSEAICSALGELERGEEESVLEAINPALSPPTSSSTIIADVPTFPSISSQPLQSAGLPAGIASSYATTTNVPQLSSAIPQLSSDVPPLSSGISSDVRLEDIELMIDTNYSGDLRPSVESAIQRKWSRIVGPEFDIVVAQLSKFEEGGGLGISLEGTVDVEGGREVRPHHYIRSILPDGPVGKNNRLCSGDELLEVNGQKLLGLNHVEVVGILKELPRYVRLVCGRRAPGAPPPLHPIDAPTADRDTFAARNILGGSLQNLIPGSERLVKAKSDGSLASSATAATNDNSFNRMKSRSLEPLTGLAMWSSECQVIELTKGDRGLGFSILDYQDPLNPQETVIVIRSLVPGGVAEKDGRLIPGDRLVAVNGTNLENATLDQAVAALKGAPKGTVSIAVAKPISVLESTGQIRSPDSDDPTGVAHPRRSLLDAILGELGTPRDTDSQLLDRSLEDDQDLNRDEASEDDLPDYDNDLDDFSEDQMYSGHRHSGSVLSSESEVPPLPLTSPPHTPAFPTDEEEEITEYDNEDSSQELLRCGGPEGEEEVEEGDTLVSREPPNLTLNLASPPNLLPPDTHEPGEVVSPINVYKASVLMVPVATERLIGSGSSTALTPAASSTPLASAHAAHYHATQGSGEEEGGSPQSSPLLPRWVAHPPVLPRELERAIKIKKGADQLGINIEVVDQGVNGVVISSLVRNGAVHKDGRLHAGDLILSVNNESMRNITNSQARAILRRTQLVSTDVSILYIRGQDAAQYREASLLHYRDGQQQQQQQQQQQALQQGQQTQPQTSPRIFPKYYRSPYVPRGESSEDEGGAEVGTDLTRSITAPSFITRDLRSRDPSHDDLIGSSGSLQQGQQTETRAEGRSVINIKHALSETFVESLTEESNISSVHIGGEKDRNLEDGEEGPFTITFKNVSAAPADFSARVGQEPEAEDHEVLGVLQDDGDVTTSEARSNSSSPMLDGKHWGPERTVEVRRDDKNSLGISIVGGKVDLSWSGSSVTGIFIKNVLPDSPAGKGGHLKTGDRILEVEGIDLRGATHEKAVEVIKKTGNPVTFVVQSLVQWTPGNSAPGSRDVSRLGTRYPTSITPARTPTPELIQARTPLSEVSSVQQLPRPAGRPYPQEPRAPVASTIPETSTPIHESCPEPVRFVPESPIPEPEDPDSLVNPYYYYARAALAHWHVRAQRTKEIQPVVEDDGDSSDQENSTSSSSGSTASRRILRLKHFCPHYGVTRTRPNGSKMDTPPSDTPLMDTPPSDGPAVEESLREEPQTPDFPRDKPPPSESFMMELSCEPILIECEEIETVRTYPQTNGLVYGSSVQSESLQSNPELDIIQCKDNDVALDSNIIQTQILLDDLPVPSLNDPEVEEYTYDWRKDPHLYQGWWCVGGSVSEHLAAQVPTQPVSPYDSPAHSPTNTPTIEQPGLPDIKKQEIQANLKKPLNRRQTTEDSDNDLDDVHYQQGRIETKKGVEIDRASAGALRRSKAEKASDTEEEDEFGYTTKKIQKKYADLKGEVVVVELQKGANGLGISLAGNKDRTLMSAFVCGLNPNGNAFKDGKIKVGDEVLEVNGNVIHGRCHLNASSIFKGIPGPKVKIIVLRKKTGLQEMAIKPITQFPVTLEDETPEEKYARFKGLTNIVMKKGQTGLGIMIIEGKHAEYGNGIFISDLQEGSVAATAGLLVGDMILCVNKEEMVGVDYDQATNILKKTEGVINMWVANAARAAGAKPDVPPKPAIAPKPSLPTKPPSLTGLPPPSRLSPPPMDDPTPSPAPPPRPLPLDRLPGLGVTSMASTTSPSTSPSSQSSLPPTEEKEKPQGSTPAAPRSLTPVDPATAEIRPGKETTIEIVKEKMGLGLSIVGGSDTLLGAIIIHEVYPDGAAAKDGRLKPGDQILNVNNENFREITHQKALSVLRQTPSKEKEKVKMVVYREEGTQKEEDLYDIITVQLTKKSGKGLGLSIVGRKNGPGVFISDVVPGGVAESDGRLMQGDQILEVNDKDLRQATQEQAAAILKCAPGSVSMKLGRLKAGKKAGANNNANSTWPVTISDNSPDVSTSPSPAEPPIPIPRTHLPPHLQTHHPLPPPPQPQHPPKDPQEPLGIRTILLERRDDGLGFSIVGGFGSNLGDLPIYVKSVFERGAAAREGSLRRGDQILEVNGQSLAGLTHADAVAILKEARGSVALTILPSK
ncbi:multiple PDZ domain protein-like isoform X14 [Scylla paramamosain]|uniref:multiple PDZ domain protein-like isoform X14 n=1 Tax=Scylla paramamosain TaxID=85552 RepID=UPI003083C083